MKRAGTRILAGFIVALGIGSVGWAAWKPKLEGESPVSASLIAQTQGVRPGEPALVGVLFDVKEGWHIYAQEPGDAGLPTKIAWNHPEDLEVHSLAWPKPQRFVDPGDLVTFGYAENVLIPFLVTVPSDFQADAVTLEAEAEWLACREICIPGSERLQLTLSVGTEEPLPSVHAERFPQHP